MSMPPIIIKTSDTPLRQYRWGYSAYPEWDSLAPFTAQAGNLTRHLGNDNGFGGKVLTFCDAMFNLHATVVFSGFSSEARVHFDHFAGRMSGGKLVEDPTSAYYFVHDPVHPENDGYFLYRSPLQPHGPTDGADYFSIPMYDPLETDHGPPRPQDLFY